MPDPTAEDMARAREIAHRLMHNGAVLKCGPPQDRPHSLTCEWTAGVIAAALAEERERVLEECATWIEALLNIAEAAQAITDLFEPGWEPTDTLKTVLAKLESKDA